VKAISQAVGDAVKLSLDSISDFVELSAGEIDEVLCVRHGGDGVLALL
jgi:hypothetical protein